MPDYDLPPIGGMSMTDYAKTDPNASPMEETLRALRYLANVETERHDDGTLTVYHDGNAVTLLPDGTLTGYDETAPH
jgi:hypothetical protein